MTTHMVGDALFQVDVDDAYGATYVLAAPVPRDDPQKTCQRSSDPDGQNR